MRHDKVKPAIVGLIHEPGFGSDQALTPKTKAGGALMKALKASNPKATQQQYIQSFARMNLLRVGQPVLSSHLSEAGERLHREFVGTFRHVICLGPIVWRHLLWQQLNNPGLDRRPEFSQFSVNAPEQQDDGQVGQRTTVFIRFPIVRSLLIDDNRLAAGATLAGLLAAYRKQRT